MAACLPGVQGTIHLTPAMAALLENSLHEDDGKLYDLLRVRVIVGAGYAGQSPGDATHSAIYGTGPVIAHLGPTSMVTDELAQMANVREERVPPARRASGRGHVRRLLPRRSHGLTDLAEELVQWQHQTTPHQLQGVAIRVTQLNEHGASSPTESYTSKSLHPGLVHPRVRRGRRDHREERRRHRLRHLQGPRHPQAGHDGDRGL